MVILCYNNRMSKKIPIKVEYNTLLSLLLKEQAKKAIVDFRKEAREEFIEMIKLERLFKDL